MPNANDIIKRATLRIRDLTEEIPHNPRRPQIPLRTKTPTHVVWHCDDAASWDVWDLINYDLRPNHISPLGCPCPTYAYYITRAGNIFKIAQEAYVTWHAGVAAWKRTLYRIPDWNEVAIAICFAHKPGPEDGLTPEQWAAGILLTTEIQIRRKWMQADDIKGHRELPGTGCDPRNHARLLKTCPGMGVQMGAARNEVRQMKIEAAAGRLIIDRVTI